MPIARENEAIRMNVKKGKNRPNATKNTTQKKAANPLTKNKNS